MENAFSTQARPEPAATRPIADMAAGSVPMLLRAEAVIELALAVSAYRHIGGTWPLFAILFLAPDITMLGYLANPRAGARLYNAGHSYLAPAVLALAGFMLATPLLYGPALIWAAHIGFDRSLGYGLKYPAAFGATHLGWKNTRRAATGSKL
jgi:hypothetical protein